MIYILKIKYLAIFTTSLLCFNVSAYGMNPADTLEGYQLDDLRACDSNKRKSGPTKSSNLRQRKAPVVSAQQSAMIRKEKEQNVKYAPAFCFVASGSWMVTRSWFSESR